MQALALRDIHLADADADADADAVADAVAEAEAEADAGGAEAARKVLRRIWRQVLDLQMAAVGGTYPTLTPNTNLPGARPTGGCGSRG